MAKTETELEVLRQMFGDVPESMLDNSGQNPDSGDTGDAGEAGGEGYDVTAEGNVAAPDNVEAQHNQDEITDERVISFLKAKGLDIDSIESLLPKPDPEVEAEKIEQRKMAYALENGLITKKGFESFIEDRSNKHDLVYNELAEDMRAEDPDITDDEIREEYESIYATSADPETSKFKRGQKLLNQRAEALLRDKHPDYYKIDGLFSDYEKQKSESEKLAKKMSETIPVYKQAVKKAVEELASIKVPVGEGTYEVKIPKQKLDEVEKAWIEAAESNVKAGLTDEQIKGAMALTLHSAELGTIINSIVNKVLEEKSKGVQGIPSNDVSIIQIAKQSKKVFTEKEKENIRSMGFVIPDSN